jgi:hypothetical protein
VTAENAHVDLQVELDGLRARIRDADSYNCHQLRGGVNIAVIRVLSLTHADAQTHDRAHSAGIGVNNAATLLENVILGDPLDVLDPEQRTEAKKQALDRIDKLESIVRRLV